MQFPPVDSYRPLITDPTLGNVERPEPDSSPRFSLTAQQIREGETAQVNGLTALRSTHMDRIYAASKVGAATAPSAPVSLPEYFEQIKVKTNKLCEDIGIETDSIVLRDSTADGLPELEMITPLPYHFKRLKNAQSALRESIALRIGDVPRPVGINKNSATTDKQLYKDALELATPFMHLIRRLAYEVKGIACFGPENEQCQVVKSPASLVRKLRDDLVVHLKKNVENFNTLEDFVDLSNEGYLKALSTFSDALRATIIIDSIDQMHRLFEKFEILGFSNRQIKGISFKNIWIENRDNGYVSIHIKLTMSYTDENGVTHQINTEVQIQFRPFFNGRKDCTKEYNHIIMEYGRKIKAKTLVMDEYDEKAAEAASLLQSLLFMKTLEESIPGLSLINRTTLMVRAIKRNRALHNTAIAIVALVAVYMLYTTVNQKAFDEGRRIPHARDQKTIADLKAANAAIQREHSQAESARAAAINARIANIFTGAQLMVGGALMSLAPPAASLSAEMIAATMFYTTGFLPLAPVTAPMVGLGAAALGGAYVLWNVGCATSNGLGYDYC